METLKNFLTGLLVCIVSLILFGLIFITWPVLLGLGSLLLSIAAGIVFIMLVFYAIVLIGYLVRSILFKKDKE